MLLLLLIALLLLLLLLLFSVVVELAEFYALRRALLLIPIAPLKPELFYLEYTLIPFELVVYLMKLSLFSWDISGILLTEEV